MGRLGCEGLPRARVSKARRRELVGGGELKLKALKASGAAPAKIRQAKQRVREGKKSVALACSDTAPITSRVGRSIRR